MNGAEARRFFFILLLLDSSAVLPDGNRDQTRSAEAADASSDAIKEKVRPAEAAISEPGGYQDLKTAGAVLAAPDGNPNLTLAETVVAAPDGNQNVKASEAVVGAPVELQGLEARSAKQISFPEQASSEDNFMVGRFLDLWKTLRADFLSCHLIMMRTYAFFLFKTLVCREFVKDFFHNIFLALHSTITCSTYCTPVLI
jgi:hypothetical protein